MTRICRYRGEISLQRSQMLSSVVLSWLAMPAAMPSSSRTFALSSAATSVISLPLSLISPLGLAFTVNHGSYVASKLMWHDHEWTNNEYRPAEAKINTCTRTVSLLTAANNFMYVLIAS